MAIYCTYFDEGYLSRGVLLIRSLLAVENGAEIWVLALSPGLREAVRACVPSPRVKVVELTTFEATRPDLVAAGTTRSRMEYLFTCTAGWVQYVMNEACSPDDWVTYLDADLYFFKSPAPIYTQLQGYSIGIVPHRFPWFRPRLRRFGVFNVGWVSFRSDAEGRRCLQWWDERCVDWCFDRVEKGRFADQGYLDQFPAISRRTRVLVGAGINLAPWNLARHNVSEGVQGQILVDCEDLIFFHFHGISQTGDRFFMKNWFYGARARGVARDRVYAPYLAALSNATSAHEQNVVPNGGPRTGLLTVRARQWVARLMGDSVHLPRDCA